MTDTLIGIPLAESGAVPFFATQALAIVLEDGVQEIWRRRTRKRGRTSSSNGGREEEGGGGWERVVGYVWVFGFAVWSTPGWSYPAARWARPEKDSMLPVRVLG